MGWWDNHWQHVLGGGGILYLGKHILFRWIDRCRDRRDRERYDRGLRQLKWEQQRERLRVQRWRDDIGRLDDDRW